MDIDTLDLDSDSALAAVYGVECEATSRARPGWTPLGEAARTAAWRAVDGWDRRLVGASEDGVLIGFASAVTAQDTPETTWVDVAVTPSHQGRGVGTRLVRAAEEMSPSGATRFVASAYRPTTAAIQELTTRFARPLGYAVASAETVVELHLSNATFPPLPTAPGYTVSTYVDGVPPDLRPEVGVLKGLVDAEAPHGDLGWQPTPVSPEEYADEISLWRRQGRTVIESVAVSDAGRVVAWTCLVVAADPARPAQIEGSMVLAEHRGSGLGRAVKTASLLVAQEHTEATRVRTSSDDQNVWMRAINDALGFVPVESEIIWQRARG